MKKLLIIFLIPLVLAGCFGSDDPTPADTNTNTEIPGKVTYKNNEFSLLVPQDWETIERTDTTSNVPLEYSVGFRNNIKSETFTANVNIAKSQITEGLTVEDFAKSTLAKVKNSLIGFQEIKNEATNLGTGDASVAAYLLEFEGKKSASDSVIRFKVILVTKAGVGYSITAAYLPAEDENVVKLTDEMLNSFTLN